MHSSTATRPSTGSADTGVRAAAHRRARGHAAASTTRCCRASRSARRPMPRELAAALGEVASVVVVARRQGSRRGRAGDARARARRARRPARRDAHLRPGDERRARARRDAAAGLRREHAAGPRGDGCLGHGRPHLQPGHPRRPGHGQRARPRRHGRSSVDHRRLALARRSPTPSGAGRARRRP